MLGVRVNVAFFGMVVLVGVNVPFVEIVVVLEEAVILDCTTAIFFVEFVDWFVGMSVFVKF